MPELAEVEFYRRRWHEAGVGKTVRRILAHAGKRVFREVTPAALTRALTGAKLVDSEAAAKQMVFRFDTGAWLGIHLGMSGELSAQPAAYPPGKHDHLVLVLDDVSLVFTDPRMFGGVRFAPGPEAPTWWTSIAPPLLSPAFTREALREFLQRRARAPIKAVLLMQERFPGVGNWMADEILWRAGIHPAEPAGTLRPAEITKLWTETRRVCRQALEKIAGRGGKLPPDLNVHIPDTWLFHHRWEAGGLCPKTRKPLARGEIGGRTTCWSPARQRLRKGPA
jgi:formamidopyrimidine-DNA glycosylase